MRKGKDPMVRFLLGIAVVVFVVWLVLTLLHFVLGGLINLLWIIILVALAVWAWHMITGRRSAV